MKRRWVEQGAAVALSAAACVSFDAASAAVPDITGTYAATIALTLSNEFEGRTDTVAVALALRDAGQRGRFTGAYTIAPNDSGPFEGSMSFNGTLWLTSFGAPPKPIAGVAHIRALYPWCDFPRLGMPAVRGSLANDTLRVSVEGFLPCFYQVADRTLSIRTQLLFQLAGVR